MDRGTEATLTRTVPGSIVKSYTKDLSLPIFELVIRHRLSRVLFYTGPSPYYDLGSAETDLCLYIITSGKAHIAAFQHGFWLRGVQP